VFRKQLQAQRQMTRCSVRLIVQRRVDV
jgi:hypothetical protein